MGTEKTRELQQAIRELCGRVGWSQKALARQLHWEINDNDNEKEIQRFEERLKKELTRSTTQPQLLMNYLDIMRCLPAIEKADVVVPQYHPMGLLKWELEEALIAVSGDISKKLQERET